MSPTTPPRRDQSIEAPPRDVGDATMQRVKGLADGWALPGQTGRLQAALPPALPPEATESPPVAPPGGPASAPALAGGSGAGQLPGLSVDAALDSLNRDPTAMLATGGAPARPAATPLPAARAATPRVAVAPPPDRPAPPPPYARPPGSGRVPPGAVSRTGPVPAPRKDPVEAERVAAAAADLAAANLSPIERAAIAASRPAPAAEPAPAPAPAPARAPAPAPAPPPPSTTTSPPRRPTMPRVADAPSQREVSVAPREISSADVIASQDVPVETTGAAPLMAIGAPPPADATAVEPLTYGGVAPPQRGLLASIRYAAHVTLYSARRFRLLRELRGEVASKRALRSQRLTELAEVALTLTDLGHKQVDLRRRQLDVLGDERKTRGASITKHEASLAAERAAYARHETAAKQRNAQIADQIQGLEDRLRPLQRDHAGLERETDRLDQENVQLGKRIATLETKLPHGAPPSEEHQRIAVEIAGLKGRREAIEREAPEIEARVSALAPQLESLRVELDSAREEQNANRRDLAAKEQRMRDTAADLEGRITAERRELDRLALESQMTMRSLGEELDRERMLHPRLTAPYRGVDELGGALTTLEYRIAELEKEGAGLDRAAIRRAAITLTVAAVVILAALIYLIFF